MTFRKRHIDNVYAKGRRQRTSAKKQEGLLFVTLLQSMLCAVMIAAAFVMSSVMGMTEIKQAYSELASGDTDAVAVFSAVSKAADLGKTEQIKNVFKLILEQVFGGEKADPSGGMLQFDPDKGGIPSNVTVAEPVTSAQIMLPLNGRMTSPFGPRSNPVTGKEDWHTGADMAAPEGTAIGAAWPGVVCSVGNDSIYGNFVTIDHGGFKTRYCHCSVIAVNEGVRLRQGETAAFSGNTGMSTGPHLHFELIIDGKCADPFAVQPRWSSIETM